MVNALRHQHKESTKATILFVDIIDRVFDCLNVSNVNKNRNRKRELNVYTSPDDWRFDVSDDWVYLISKLTFFPFSFF